MEHPGDVSVQWLSILDQVDVMRASVVLLLVPERTGDLSRGGAASTSARSTRVDRRWNGRRDGGDRVALRRRDEA